MYISHVLRNTRCVVFVVSLYHPVWVFLRWLVCCVPEKSKIIHVRAFVDAKIEIFKRHGPAKTFPQAAAVDMLLYLLSLVSLKK